MMGGGLMRIWATVIALAAWGCDAPASATQEKDGPSYAATVKIDDV
jgi:hypothetical protein